MLNSEQGIFYHSARFIKNGFSFIANKIPDLNRRRVCSEKSGKMLVAGNEIVGSFASRGFSARKNLPCFRFDRRVNLLNYKSV